MANEGSYLLGWGVGWMVGWALVRRVLAALTAGIGGDGGLVKAVIKGFFSVICGGWIAIHVGLRAALAAAPSLIDDVVRLLRTISLPSLGKVGQWLKGTGRDSPPGRMTFSPGEKRMGGTRMWTADAHGSVYLQRGGRGRLTRPGVVGCRGNVDALDAAP